ncbi:MAG: Na+/H+ antiporter NhaC family protein [Planctomycetota bacterium]
MSQRKSEVSMVNRWSLGIAWLPVVVLVVLLGFNVWSFGADSSYGPNQIALLLATMVAGIIGMRSGATIDQLVSGAETSIRSALKAILILLLIGSLSGTWMMSGIVPTMIYLGLDILHPSLFLLAATLICAVVSVATGSSWSTIATIGIALLGIGLSLGISPGLAAGAIISGAYFGDKISPLSDTTNLAAAMTGTELTTHIRYMLWTTVPSFSIAVLAFLVIGLRTEGGLDSVAVTALQQELASQFDTLNPWLMVVPASVLLMVIRKFDALAALLIGTLLGVVVALLFQPTAVRKVAGCGESASYMECGYLAMNQSMALETSWYSDDQISDAQQRVDEFDALVGLIDEQANVSDPTSVVWQFAQAKATLAASSLLRGKGMVGMLNTVWLILMAMVFGGFMNASGCLERITTPFIRSAKSDASLIATTTGSCVFVNLTASDQYLAIVVPGQMFRRAFADRKLASENLSRTLEDGGTVTSVLIPWNTCGAAQAGVLGIATVTFAPYCLFNWISPLMTLLVAYSGIGITRTGSSPIKSEPSRER